MRRQAYTLVELLVTSSILVAIAILATSSFIGNASVQITYQQGQSTLLQMQRVTDEISKQVELTSGFPGSLQTIHLTQTTGSSDTTLPRYEAYPADDLLLLKVFPRDGNGAVRPDQPSRIYAYCAALVPDPNDANKTIGKQLQRFTFLDNSLTLPVSLPPGTPECTGTYVNAIFNCISGAHCFSLDQFGSPLVANANFQVLGLRFWSVWPSTTCGTLNLCDVDAPGLKMELNAQYSPNNAAIVAEQRVGTVHSQMGFKNSGNLPVTVQAFANRAGSSIRQPAFQDATTFNASAGGFQSVQ